MGGLNDGKVLERRQVSEAAVIPLSGWGYREASLGSAWGIEGFSEILDTLLERNANSLVDSVTFELLLAFAVVAGVLRQKRIRSGRAKRLEKAAKGKEKRLTNRPRPFYQLTNIANPTLEAFLPENGVLNGTAVLVCPGGGMQRLAYEHEGLEVAKWLNSQGVMAFVLKYRIPTTALEGLMDAQRAMGIIRSEASRWGLRKDSVGFLGFSAGGEIGTWLACRYEGRAYARVDARDEFLVARFCGMVYPGGL